RGDVVEVQEGVVPGQAQRAHPVERRTIGKIDVDARGVDAGNVLQDRADLRDVAGGCRTGDVAAGQRFVLVDAAIQGRGCADGLDRSLDLDVVPVHFRGERS